MRVTPGSRLEAAIRAAQARDAAARAGLAKPQDGPQGPREIRPPVEAGKPGRASGGPAQARRGTGQRSALVEDLAAQCRVIGLPAPEREVLIIPGRRFRADLAWPAARLYVEVDGGTWVGGRHGQGSGIRSDCEKTSLAAGLGWRLVRTDDHWIRKGIAVRWIEAALAWRPPVSESPGPSPSGR